MKNKLNKGFVSITLVIGVSSILLAFMLVRSLETFHFFDLSLRKQYRLENFYNAHNCLDRAKLKLAHDYFYEVSEPVYIKELNCLIKKVKRNGNNIEIETIGTSGTIQEL